MASCSSHWVLKMVIVGISVIYGYGDVTYNARSLIINGEHKILFSGSIHYPRSTPEMWPSLIAKAKEGGIDVIQTYVFWNLHEPQSRQYDFNGRNDIVRFIREIQAQGLYASLRLGPFIEGEWTYGGFPSWLQDIPNIVFRSNNEPFKVEMKRFTTMIVNMMKAEKLYASQGGPIILSQIENEYQTVEPAYHADGPLYIEWAAEMAVGLQTGVPWMMCKQDDAPDSMINTCNGMRCGKTFKGPNSPNKPAMWTENWTSFYQVFGQDPVIRSPEDIAFHVALFIANNKGSFINYYMYHGGTNFGRTAASYMTTSYYDQAPLDEYGLVREPKWGHLKELHAAIKLSSEVLIHGVQTNISLSIAQQAFVYETETGECAAFLFNYDNRREVTVVFRNVSYVLPSKSVSILPDCKTVAFNSAKVTAQYSTRSMISGIKLDSREKWNELKESIPSYENMMTTRASRPVDQISTAKAVSDYLWYSFRFQHNNKSGTNNKLSVISNAPVLHAFVNGQYVGSEHGSRSFPSYTLDSTVSLNAGTNIVSLLSVMVGLPDSGAHLERRTAGVQRVVIQSDQGTRDFTNYEWGFQVGLAGERSQVFSDQVDGRITWNALSGSHQPLTWYKTTFDAPEGDDPVALNLASMGKGEAWINGQSIGRYWVSFLTKSGVPSQSWYHIPRSLLISVENTLVLLEEEGNVDPLKITIDTVLINKVCVQVSESDMPLVISLKRQNYSETDTGSVASGSNTDQFSRSELQIHCPTRDHVITKIVFASYGNPSGGCGGSHALGSCHSDDSFTIVKNACVGKRTCSIPVSQDIFKRDPCPGIRKSLLVEALCS